MKTILSKILVVVLLLSSVLSIAASPGNLRILRTPFTGSEAFDQFIDPGTTEFVGGKYITKGLIVISVDTASDPRVSGDVTITANSVYAGEPPPFGTGPFWGTSHLTNANGGWNIVWAGYQSEGCLDIVYAWGKGEGDYEGMKAVWESQSDNCMYTSTFSGVITEHK
jgi:hypothetical protein